MAQFNSIPRRSLFIRVHLETMNPVIPATSMFRTMERVRATQICVAPMIMYLTQRNRVADRGEVHLLPPAGWDT